jgi:hypothetical protein
MRYNAFNDQLKQFHGNRAQPTLCYMLNTPRFRSRVVRAYPKSTWWKEAERGRKEPGSFEFASP